MNIKKCPFCASTITDPQVRKHYRKDEDGWSQYLVVCDDCGATGGLASDGGLPINGKSMAVAIWNNRHRSIKRTD